MEVVVAREPAVVAADRIARRLRAASQTGAATLALSGGSVAPAMIGCLVELDVPWDRVEVWQVDERVAPDGDRARNANQLVSLPCRVHPMPVTARDLRAAARRYAERLPERFDVVHLGIGPDGHTASWPPGRDEVATSARSVELVDEFNGLPRMTLTRRVVNAARARVVVATGAAKRPVIERWLAGDPALPISLVRRTTTLVVLDQPSSVTVRGTVS